LQTLREILTAPLKSGLWPTLDDFWPHLQSLVREAKLPVDAAIVGGFQSEILATAFAVGYQAALHALFPKLPHDTIISLCVTERGGGHPRAILSRLEPLETGSSGTYSLSGEKRWATLSDRSSLLLVVARAGEDATTNRAIFRIVRVSPHAMGVRVTPMPETPFVPEIRHCEISFDEVIVDEENLIPGDGYEDFVKPFRTVEDIHVQAAGAAYLVRICRKYNLGPSLLERLAQVLASLRALAAADPKDALTHVILAGVLHESSALLREIDSALAKADPMAHAKFAQDKPIFEIAARVRAERANKAWERLSNIELR
jgi:acyl-CoA dehydrogenase